MVAEFTSTRCFAPLQVRIALGHHLNELVAVKSGL
jgi:hypothetical protein